MSQQNLKNILVTGGAGFIGSNFVPYFLNARPDIRLINLDKLTYAGNPANLKEAEGDPRYVFVKGDICDRTLVQRLFDQYRFQGVIHFAAESHVDNSISGPEAFIQTNIVGSWNLIETARRAWLMAPFQVKDEFKSARFLHVSTDEVYGSLGDTGLFSETTAYAPNSPYSASKASSDLLVRSYFHTYGLNVVTTNCSNNYGPKQHHEKLIPVIIRRALSHEPIPVYGDGKNVRDWLYVTDHCRGIDLAFAKGRAGETYNIGGKNERQNIEIVRTICAILDDLRPLKGGEKYEKFISYVKDRPGHDKRYAIDASKIENELGWRAQETFTNGIRKTVEWYLQASDHSGGR
jgi:dTDP-glucose 4,6-dehydratase